VLTLSVLPVNKVPDVLGPNLGETATGLPVVLNDPIPESQDIQSRYPSPGPRTPLQDG
jgi:hypothetical protein